ncbi:MAG: hypothetical protein JO156_10010, partial [Solirubrobacterales bacterium]|nr:hypothetical protein [Solirubrobacterales bacterium]
DGAPLDDLALWAVPARGRMLLRELRTFATVAATDYADNGPPGYSPLGSGRGGLEVAGFAISDETAAAIEQLDLAAASVPPSSGRRVLLLGRDGIDPDERLRARFADSGVEVTVAPGRGYAEMMTHPQFARTPREELVRVVSWFERAPAEAADASRRPRVSVTALQTAELRAGGIPILERPLAFEHAGIALRGVLTEPRPTLAAAPQTCAVLLSAGAIRRIGPNRMWVETARRWAARGIPTVRLDVKGVGDADGDESRYLETAQFYRPELTEQVLAALDGLVAQGLPGRFVLGGLCSGAYWALHAALADQRVVGLQLVNLHSFFWNELDVSSRNLRLAGAYLRERRWREMVRIAASERRIARTVRAQLRAAIDPSVRNARKPGGDRVDRALDELRDRGVETLLLFSEGEPLEDSLSRTGRLERLPSWPNLRLERIPIKDHTFRAAWAQRRASEILDAALARSLAGS